MKVALVTVAEAARQPAVAEVTVRGLIERGELHATKIGRSIGIEQNELVAFVRKQGGSGLIAKQLTPGHLQHKQPQRTAKRWALNRASDRFGRLIVSANDLSEVEASWVPDLIDDELEHDSDSPRA